MNFLTGLHLQVACASELDEVRMVLNYPEKHLAEPTDGVDGVVFLLHMLATHCHDAQ